MKRTTAVILMPREYRAVIQRIQTVIAKVMVVTQGEQAVVILLILIKLPSLNLCSYPA